MFFICVKKQNTPLEMSIVECHATELGMTYQWYARVKMTYRYCKEAKSWNELGI